MSGRHFDVLALVQAIRQTDLIEDFQQPSVDRIAAEISIESRVFFEQRHRHTLARQRQKFSACGTNTLTRTHIVMSGPALLR